MQNLPLLFSCLAAGLLLHRAEGVADSRYTVLNAVNLSCRLCAGSRARECVPTTDFTDVDASSASRRVHPYHDAGATFSQLQFDAPAVVTSA